MEGKSGGDAAWDEDEDEVIDEKSDESEDIEEKQGEKGSGREGRWESGKGRCAVTGRRVLGGVDGLRRVMV